MNDLYDVYKEEAMRILYGPGLIRDNVCRFIEGLRFGDLVPGVEFVLSENHCQTREQMEITVSGHATVLENQAWHGDKRTIRTRLQNRWLVRKLNDYGRIIEAVTSRVRTNRGIVYFSYRLIVKLESHIV